MTEEKKGAAAKMSEILNGWKNVVFPNEHVEKIAKARMTSPKKANRGASATNPLGRGGYDG